MAGIKDRFIVKGVGAVRSFKIKAGDGSEHEVFYYAKSPNEIAQYFAAQVRFESTPEGDVQKQDHRATFIAANMVEADGKTAMFAIEEARLIPVHLKPLFIAGIVEGSNTIEGVKKS